MRIEVSSEFADFRLEQTSGAPNVVVYGLEETTICTLPLVELVAMVRVLAAGVQQQ